MQYVYLLSKDCGVLEIGMQADKNKKRKMEKLYHKRKVFPVKPTPFGQALLSVLIVLQESQRRRTVRNWREK